MRTIVFDDNTEDDWVDEGEIVEIMKHGSSVVAIAVHKENALNCKDCAFSDNEFKYILHCRAPYSKDKSYGNCKVCWKNMVHFIPIDKTLENL